MAGEHLTDLESIDVSFGTVISGAYKGLAEVGTSAYIRFLKRKDKEKIFRIENSDPQQVLSKIAGKDNKHLRDLPLVAYYREHGINGDMNQSIVALNVLCEADNPKENTNLAVSSIPLTDTYSVLFAAWDRATLDKISLAWFCYLAPQRRKHTRFITYYTIDGETIEVPSSVSAPRQVMSSAESFDSSSPRLWAARCTVEVNTQILCGQSMIIPQMQFQGMAGVMS